MRVRDFSWTIALCASMTAHAVVIRWRAERYVADHTPLRLAGLPANRGIRLAREKSVDEVDLGESSGLGRATDASPGETEMRARAGDQDQSFLSRDPEGPGKVGDLPSQSVVPPGENGANGAAGSEQATFGAQPSQQSEATPNFKKLQQPPREETAEVPQEQPPTQQLALQQAPQQAPSQQKPVTHLDGPGLAPPPPAPAPPTRTVLAMSTPRPQSAAQRASESANSAPAGKPGPNTPAADPAPQGETESDPFAVDGSAEFRRGSTKVQFGRAHKLTRPRFSWDTAFLGMNGCTVTLDLQLNEQGKVVNATVIQSSGSEQIDQPCRIAAYEWWFEPAHDHAGNAIRDDIKFTLKFL